MSHLFVTNVSARADLSSLRYLFGQYGNIVMMSGNRDGCAIVEFETPDEAELAFNALQGKTQRGWPKSTDRRGFEKGYA